MTRFLLTFVACIIGVSPLLSQRSPAAEALLLQGLESAVRHDYAAARVAFDSASRLDRSDPAGLVLLAGMMQQSAEDLSAPFDRRVFDSLLTQAEVRSTSGSASETGDSHLWRSTARGMLSVVEAQSGEWMAAIRDALASASEGTSALKSDPDLVDAGLPLGNYLYWRSRKTEALRWLPFVSDDRSEGIRLLERCAEEGRYHRWASVSSLIWILHDAGELDRAEQWARTGLSAFPGNRTFLAGLAMVLETRRSFAEASHAWRKVAESLQLDRNAGSYAVFSALVNQLRCASSAGELLTAQRLVREILPPSVSDVPQPIHRRLEAKTKEWERLRAGVAGRSGLSAPHPGSR